MKKRFIPLGSNLVKLFFLGLLLIGLYYPALSLMVRMWDNDQYSYCYLVPFVVLYLIWEKRIDLMSTPSVHSWKGMVPIIFGIVFFWIGELGGEYLTLLISFWLVLIGLCWIYLGWEKLKTIGFALFFMLTMFPLPYFLNTKLMLQLRLISSKLGVFLIQLFGLPATRYGNIIDLGFTKLQIVEACSGLHSLISLVVLCLLLAHFFKDHIWKRAVLLLSSILLAIFTNSLRIAITAILHKYFGAEVAQGFFHEFSGLVIFLLCVPVLFIEMKILKKLPPIKTKRKLEQKEKSEDYGKMHIMDNDTADRHRKSQKSSTSNRSIIITTLILLCITLILSQGVDFREKIPVNKSLSQFPLAVGEWKANGREKMAQKFLDVLDLSEYVILDYQNRDGKRVNFYVAYYESQSKGKSIHTPESCLPGSGWSVDESGTEKLFISPGDTKIMEVNRAVMQYGRSTQITYFWFFLRGRIVNNAYQLKLYNFWDALTMQRTDGALVRLITPVYETENLEDADTRLQNFLRDIVPVLEDYIPGKELPISSY
jgi:exosortase D (VPLPA-CTERM-specific)